MYKYQCLLLSLLILSACQSSGGGDNVVKETAVLPTNAVVTPYVDEEGLSYAVHKNFETILEEGDILNGVKHGTWTTYNDDGMPTATSTYFEGKKQGVEFRFGKLGYPESKAYYHNDELHGEFLVYDRRKVVERRNYEYGVLNGMLTKYYNNGTLMQEAPYINGVLHGIGKWYDQEGNLSIAYEYENGELINKDPVIEE